LVSPPSWRFDIENEMDLVEEYARLNGYSNIPETIPALTNIPAGHDRHYMLHQQIVGQMISLGFSQAINMAFVSENFQKKILGDFTPTEPVKLLNPLSEDLSVMRTSLVPGLVKNMNHNFHHGVENGRLFEVGHVFSKKIDASNEEYQQWARLSGVIWGQSLGLWNKGLKDVPVVFEIKGAIEALLESLSIKSFEWSKPSSHNDVFLHHGQVAYLKVEGKHLGYIGTLHPVLVDDLKLRADGAVFELDLDQLLKGQPRAYRVDGVSKMPMVQRDLALVMPTKFEVGYVSKEILKIGKPLLKSVNVFDIYQGENLDMGKKSVTFRLMFQDPDLTLTEVQIAEQMDKLIAGLKVTKPEVLAR
jgi:phenylalanyl-tRNA synthetase beta chain